MSIPVNPDTRLRQIAVSARVDLYFNDEGFRFCLANDRPIGLDCWAMWSEHWRLYKQDKIQQKVYSYLDQCPEHLKGHTFYQQLKFDYDVDVEVDNSADYRTSNLPSQDELTSILVQSIHRFGVRDVATLYLRAINDIKDGLGRQGEDTLWIAKDALTISGVVNRLSVRDHPFYFNQEEKKS